MGYDKKDWLAQECGVHRSSGTFLLPLVPAHARVDFFVFVKLPRSRNGVEVTAKTISRRFSQSRLLV